MSAPSANIGLTALHAVSLFASKEETRYYLNGVLIEIEPGHITYVATDGHRMMSVRVDLGKDEPQHTLLGKFIIPTSHCRPFKKITFPYAEMTSDEGKWLTLTYVSDRHVFKPIDGTFPDWRKVMPTTDRKATMPLSFNWEHMAAFVQAGKLLEAGTPQLLPNGLYPAIIRFSQNLNAVGVLMPMRGPDFSKTPLPKWSHHPIPVEPAPAELTEAA